MDPSIEHNPVGILCWTETAEEIALTSCDITADIGARLALVGVTQAIRNVTPDSREVTYAFPRPMSSQVLGMSARLGDRTVRLEPKLKKEAESIYEQERENGNTPALLKDLGEDVICLHLGRLLPGETAEIDLRFGIPLRLSDRQRGELRIPTAISPRYGRPGSAERAIALCDPSLLVEHPLSLRVTMRGALRDARVSSPSHRLCREEATDDRAVHVLESPAFKDRDIVLQFDGITATHTGMVSKDPFGGGHVVWVDVVDDKSVVHRDRNIHILADCSASMGGDGESTLRSFLDELRPLVGDDDAVSLSRFGTGHEPVFVGAPGALARKLLAHETPRIRADMGMTELRAALTSVLATHGSGTDIVLLTDGLVNEGADLVEHMRGKHHRVFAVGIGAAPRDTLLDDLSVATDGHAIFPSSTSSASDAAKTIARLTSLSKRRITDIDWNGDEPEWSDQLPQTIIPGVPLPVVGKFAAGQTPPGRITVTIEGEPVEVPLTEVRGTEDELAKLMAQRRHLAETDPGVREGIALKYGLVTSDVALVGAIERRQPNRGATTQSVVRPMLTEGYGGIRSAGETVARALRGPGVPGESGLACNLACCLVDASGELASMRAFHEDNTLALNSPVGIYREKEAALRPVGGTPPPCFVPPPAEEHESLPNRCPGRFLAASDWDGARAALSKDLARVCDHLAAFGWTEAQVWGSLLDSVCARTADAGMPPPAIGGEVAPPLVELFGFLLSDRLRKDRWRHKAKDFIELVFGEAGLVRRIKAGPDGIADPDGCTLAEAGELTGLPPRMIRLYFESGVVERPPGDPGEVRFPGRLLDDLRAVRRLAEDGRGLDDIRAIMRQRRGNVHA